MLYFLNIYNCQLYINKAGKKLRKFSVVFDSYNVQGIVASSLSVQVIVSPQMQVK